jgi:hypothetical protein
MVGLSISCRLGGLSEFPISDQGCFIQWHGLLNHDVTNFSHALAGYSESVSLGFSFVFSVLLVIGSVVITVAIIVYYCLVSRGIWHPREGSPDPPDPHRF